MQDSSLDKIPRVDVKLELDDPPTRKDFKKATMQLKVGRSPGMDGIPAEVYQHGGEAVLDKLQDLFTNCWEKGTLPQDIRDAVIVSLYRNKEENSYCSNYRGITLLSITGQNLGSRLTEQAHSDDSTGKHARKPVWVRVQQRDRRHDLCAEADTGEMQRTEYRSICSFHRPDQGL